MRPSVLGWLAAIVLVLASGGCTNGADGGDAGAVAAKSTAAAEQQLLRRYVDTFKAMASAGSPEAFPEAIAELALSAKRLRSEDKLSDAFYGRYEQLLDVSSALVEPRDDPAAEANLNRKLERFAKQVKGDDAPSVTDATLATVSQLFVDEVINLHLVSDPSSSREAARKLYFDP